MTLDFVPHPRSPLQESDCPPSLLSPLSSSTSLSPPPRLHLRTLLPSPPLPQPPPSTAPPVPYPWIWKCHLCNSIYRLGVTRRCLEDGHFFCSVVSEPLTVEQDAGNRVGRGRWSGEESAGEKRRRKRRKKREGKGEKGCVSEFDYTGWLRYNLWRREVAVLKCGREVKSGYRVMETRQWELLVSVGMRDERREKDCWRDCDFPSQCLNEGKVETEWVAQREKVRELEEEWARELERLSGEVETSVVEQEAVDVVDFYGSEETQDGSVVVKGKTDSMGPLGTDCDGLGEEVVQAEYTKSRRKSLDAAAESPPSSPLKSCSFGFEGVDLGCDVWAGERGDGLMKEKNDGEDLQMQDLVKGGNLLLRKYRKGDDGERFGDEEDDNVL